MIDFSAAMGYNKRDYVWKCVHWCPLLPKERALTAFGRTENTGFPSAFWRPPADGAGRTNARNESFEET